MNALRRLFYALGRLLGDANAVQRGRIGSRIVNKAIGRAVVSKLWR